VEDEVLREQIEQYNETVSRYQHPQHVHLGHYQPAQQDVERYRQTHSTGVPSAPTDVVQALLDMSTLPSTTVHLAPSDFSHAGH